MTVHVVDVFDLDDGEGEGLGPGRWVRYRSNGPQVFVPDPPTPTEFRYIADLMGGVLERLVWALPTRFVGALCECGCAVLPGENCPACLVWAIKDAERHAWGGPLVTGEVWALRRSG